CRVVGDTDAAPPRKTWAPRWSSLCSDSVARVSMCADEDKSSSRKENDSMMSKRVLSVLVIVVLLGVVGAATAQYGGGGGSGGGDGTGGMSGHLATSGGYTLTKLVGDTAGAAAI